MFRSSTPLVRPALPDQPVDVTLFKLVIGQRFPVESLQCPVVINARSQDGVPLESALVNHP
jgi:hypothetical protein